MERVRPLDLEASAYFLTYNANFIAQLYDSQWVLWAFNL